MTKYNKYNKEELEDLIVTQNLSYEEIGRKFGVTGNAIKKAAMRRGIDVPKRSSYNKSDWFDENGTRKPRLCLNCGKKLGYKVYKYCSEECKKEYLHNQYIKEWEKGNKTGNTCRPEVSKHVKQYLFNKYKKCQICGWKEVNPITKTVPLQIYHIDGDNKNSSKDNLMVLCPNCYAIRVKK